MARRPIYKVHVAEKSDFSKSLRRIVLQSESLKAFPANQEGSYIKLLLARDDSPSLDGLIVSEANPSDFIKRSYTVSESDQDAGTLTIDMVRHADGGPATRWSETCQVSDEVLITGPGPVKMLSQGADWFFLVGDSAAFPAMLANLRTLSSNAKGYALFEIHEDEEQFQVEAPAGIEVHWVKASSSADASTEPAQLQESEPVLAEQSRKLEWLDGRVSVWGAAEFSSMQALRAYFVKERCVPRDDIYLSSYWKRGASDEQHKKAKANEKSG